MSVVEVFQKQSLLQLSIETGYDLSAASVTQINFKKPNGATGFFPGTVSGTKLTYDLQNGDIDRAGLWEFQVYIVVAGRNAPGKIVQHFFEKPLL